MADDARPLAGCSGGSAVVPFLFFFPPLCVCCLGNSIGTLFSHPVCYLSCSNFSILFWLGWIIRPGRETTLQHHVLLPRHYWLYTALLNISKCSSKNTTSFNFSFFLLLPPSLQFVVFQFNHVEMPICDTPIFVSLSTEIVVGALITSRQTQTFDLWCGGPGILPSNGRTHGTTTTESVHVAAGNLIVERWILLQSSLSRPTANFSLALY